MRSFYNKILSPLACCIFIIGCTDKYTICDQSRTVNYKAGFYNKNGTADVPATPVSLTLTFPGVSSYIYFQAAGISTLNLALNPASDSVRYRVQVENALREDTLTLVYTTQLQTLSPECGDIYVHRLTRAYTTTYTLDSVRIVNPVVNTTSLQNLRIYY